MNLSIDVDSRAVQRAFKNAPRVTARKLQDWTEDTAASVERHAKTREVPVVKAQLQNSIHMTVRPLNVIVKPNTEYMWWVHDGAKSPHAPTTHRNSSYRGNPFMTRTFTYIQPQADREAQKVLREIVRAI